MRRQWEQRARLGVLTAETEVLDRFRTAADVGHDLAEQPAYHVPLAAGARRPTARRSRDEVPSESYTAELGGRGKDRGVVGPLVGNAISKPAGSTDLLRSDQAFLQTIEHPGRKDFSIMDQASALWIRLAQTENDGVVLRAAHQSSVHRSVAPLLLPYSIQSCPRDDHCARVTRARPLQQHSRGLQRRCGWCCRRAPA